MTKKLTGILSHLRMVSIFLMSVFFILIGVTLPDEYHPIKIFIYVLGFIGFGVISLRLSIIDNKVLLLGDEISKLKAGKK